ncbi:alkaline phosphatase family protein [Halorussus litoreus]|uniref:alkaline phosphatase family protein n=1 Tax=Halorussus litoreus TaxID=1710536 RepID=UPI000E25019C|nr:alkaline phosphatase family protein [Halorussus litoreus]
MTTESSDTDRAGRGGTDRAFVLGLDGVPWYLVDDWVRDGELPNFRRLVREGAAGPLESTMPPTTALAWPTIATGTWADKHGVYSFQGVRSDYTHEMNTSNDVERPELWDLVSPAVVANVPMTYPADEIEGKLVTGMMTPDQGEGFTHPPELRDEIAEEIPDYRIGLSWEEFRDDPEGFLDEMDSFLDARKRLLRKLMDTDDWRLFFFVFTAPDRLQHLVWDEDVLLDHYRELDAVLGEVLDYVEDSSANLYVVSDHGFGPIEGFVHTNTFFEREGFLSRKGGSSRGLLESVGITKDRVRSVLDATGVDEATLQERLPDRLVNSVASGIPGSHELFDVDFSETVAFTHGAGHLYVNDTERFDDGVVAPERIPEVKAAVRSSLESLPDPDTGEPFLNVADGDDLFDDDDHSPDLVVRSGGKYLVANGLTDVVFRESYMDAAHRKEGVFFAWGPSVESGVALEDATVADVAPTVLHGMGDPVPEAADGRVLSEVFARNSAAADRPVRERSYAESGESAAVDDGFDDVEARLQGLGYME